MPIAMKKDQYITFFREANKSEDGFLTFKELCGMLKDYQYPVQEESLMVW